MLHAGAIPRNLDKEMTNSGIAHDISQSKTNHISNQ